MSTTFFFPNKRLIRPIVQAMNENNVRPYEKPRAWRRNGRELSKAARNKNHRHISGVIYRGGAKPSHRLRRQRRQRRTAARGGGVSRPEIDCANDYPK